MKEWRTHDGHRNPNAIVTPPHSQGAMSLMSPILPAVPAANIPTVKRHRLEEKKKDDVSDAKPSKGTTTLMSPILPVFPVFLYVNMPKVKRPRQARKKKKPALDLIPSNCNSNSMDNILNGSDNSSEMALEKIYAPDARNLEGATSSMSPILPVVPDANLPKVKRPRQARKKKDTSDYIVIKGRFKHPRPLVQNIVEVEVEEAVKNYEVKHQKPALDLIPSNCNSNSTDNILNGSDNSSEMALAKIYTDY